MLEPEREEQLSNGTRPWLSGLELVRAFLELRTVTPTRGADQRTQAYLVPGFNVKPHPGITLRLGVPLPVTSAREFDYQIRAAAVWEF